MQTTENKRTTDNQQTTENRQTIENQQTIKSNAAIEKLILAYAKAFNAANIAETVSLFTDDGILMPNSASLSQGKKQLTASFESLLKNFRIHIGYTIDEITLIGDYALVRTNSKVSTHIYASREDVSLLNKELFVVRREYEAWKISHYIFNNTSIVK